MQYTPPLTLPPTPQPNSLNVSFCVVEMTYFLNIPRHSVRAPIFFNRMKEEL
jgi:hypothetical protein